MVRTPCCKAEGLKKGAWTPEEDEKLIAYVHEHGEGGWRTLPEKAGLPRCGKSCRLRWANYLRPDIKRGEFTAEEEETIINLHASRGNKWSAIARRLPGRTDNEIKNYWNTHIRKRLIQKGIDPVTHKPISEKCSEKNPADQTSQDSKKVDSEKSGKTRLDSESETNNENKLQPCLSQKPVSGSAQLLNKVANKFALKVSQSVLTQIIEGSAGRNNKDHLSTNSPTISSASSASETTVSGSSSCLTSKLVNGMAARPTMLGTVFQSSSDLETFQADLENKFHFEEPFSELSIPDSDDYDFQGISLENWIIPDCVKSMEIVYDHSTQNHPFGLCESLDTSNGEELIDGMNIDNIDFTKDLTGSFHYEPRQKDKVTQAGENEGGEAFEGIENYWNYEHMDSKSYSPLDCLSF